MPTISKNGNHLFIEGGLYHEYVFPLNNVTINYEDQTNLVLLADGKRVKLSYEQLGFSSFDQLATQIEEWVEEAAQSGGGGGGGGGGGSSEITSNSSVSYGGGVSDAKTQRVISANNDPSVTSLSAINGKLPTLENSRLPVSNTMCRFALS